MQWPGGEKNPRAAILPLESDRSFFAKFSRFLPPAQWYNNNTGSNNEMSNSKEQWFLFFFLVKTQLERENFRIVLQY